MNIQQDDDEVPGVPFVDDDKLIYQIGRIRLEPGDVLVLKTSMLFDKDQVAAIRERVKPFVPNNEVMIIIGDFDLMVLSQRATEAQE